MGCQNRNLIVKCCPKGSNLEQSAIFRQKAVIDLEQISILNGMTNKSISPIIFVQGEGMEPVQLIRFKLVADHIQKIQINFISF